MKHITDDIYQCEECGQQFVYGMSCGGPVFRKNRTVAQQDNLTKCQCRCHESAYSHCNLCAHLHGYARQIPTQPPAEPEFTLQEKWEMQNDAIALLESRGVAPPASRVTPRN